jgi:hypothetical protein
MKAILAPGRFAASAEWERPVKSLFWACIKDMEGFLSVVKNFSKAELMPILQDRIVEGSDVYTDDIGLVYKIQLMTIGGSIPTLRSLRKSTRTSTLGKFTFKCASSSPKFQHDKVSYKN